ncbi:holo-ACP synthase [Christensenella tenuis]|uniref:Holo-[acyl-carrier-protein] synthase n=1 Tax=Christensenella tenuis TaxID=2763033 RepID=A0ABR7ECU7_9FIRM|nr:holo-ACP synthase [Christensenella tenuis]MBC5646869.1 holo-ACP synthase [Christensenella tenuis]
MIIGVGIDSLRIARMENAIKREAFLKRVFTERERRYLDGKKLAAQSAAGMFCAKEAVLKALSLGIIDARLTDIEILHKESGAPYAVLHGPLEGKTALHISITHTEDTASAIAILEREERPE